MKRAIYLIMLLSASLLAAGCTDDFWGGLDDFLTGGDGQTVDGGINSNGCTPGGSITTSVEAYSNSDDEIANTTFARTISIVFSPTGDATVTGDTKGFVTVSGNGVTVRNTGSEVIMYELSGSTSNGFFKLYSSKKQGIKLNGVSITNPNGAAINNQSKKRTFVVVEGTNSLSDGASYTATPEDEDEKAAFFSEAQLIFSGSGSLTVTAKGKAGITSDDYIRFMASPTVKVSSSAGHGVRGKDYILVTDGTIDVSTSANMKKGFSADSLVRVDGGVTTIRVSGGVAYDKEDEEYTGSAGIKADKQFLMTGGTLTVTNTGAGGKGIRAGSFYDSSASDHTLPESVICGGTLSVTTSGAEANDVSAKAVHIGYKELLSGTGNNAKYACGGDLVVCGTAVINITCAKDEGLEVKGNLTFNGGETWVTSTGDDAINSAGELNVNGGYIYAYSSQNDAMDANCDMKLSGGYVCAITTKGAPEVALDANTEDGFKLYVNSGVTLVTSGGLEKDAAIAQGCYSIGCTGGTWNALASSTGVLCAFNLPTGISSVVVSAPSLAKGLKSVSVSGSTFCNGVWALAASGGSEVSLGSYSGGQGGGPTGGGGGTPPPGGR